MRSNSRDLVRELPRELTTRDVTRDILHYPGKLFQYNVYEELPAIILP